MPLISIPEFDLREGSASNSRGFTLVEVLVAIALVGVLSLFMVTQTEIFSRGTQSVTFNQTFSNTTATLIDLVNSQGCTSALGGKAFGAGVTWPSIATPTGPIISVSNSPGLEIPANGIQIASIQDLGPGSSGGENYIGTLQITGRLIDNRGHPFPGANLLTAKISLYVQVNGGVISKCCNAYSAC